jgi:hypothetical protein
LLPFHRSKMSQSKGCLPVKSSKGNLTLLQFRVLHFHMQTLCLRASWRFVKTPSLYPDPWANIIVSFIQIKITWFDVAVYRCYRVLLSSLIVINLLSKFLVLSDQAHQWWSLSAYV